MQKQQNEKPSSFTSISSGQLILIWIQMKRKMYVLAFTELFDVLFIYICI